MDAKDMESMSPETQVALLQASQTTLQGMVGEIKADIKEIKGFMSTLNNHYVTRGEFEAFKKQYWLSHTLTALIVATITALAYHFFSVRG